MMGLWNKLARPRAERAVSTYVHCYCRDQGRPGAYCSPVIRAGAAAGQLDFFCAANHAIEPRVGLGETGCGCVAARPLRPPIRMSSYAVRPGNRRVRLEDKVRRRALEGVSEPLAGKLVRGDDGRPITVQCHSDNLLWALYKTRRPPRRERSVRFATAAMGGQCVQCNGLADAVGTGEIESVGARNQPARMTFLYLSTDRCRATRINGEKSKVGGGAARGGGTPTRIGRLLRKLCKSQLQCGAIDHSEL